MRTIKANDWSEVPENYTGVVNFPNRVECYKDGIRHRDGSPAVEYSDGHKEWWFDGKLHRTDGPAVEFSGGQKEWWFEGNLHREDGPAVEYADGDKQWYKEGKRHREDGPAVEYSGGTKFWYLEDQDYEQINLKDYVILGYDKGEYGIMWYRLLDKDRIFECPDIPGLIKK